MKHDSGGSAQINSWGDELRGWSTNCPNRVGSFDSSIVSIDDHSQLTMKHLMERDDPTRNCSAFSSGEEVMLVHDSSDIEMVPNEDPPECHSEDSAPDSTSDGENSVNDPGSSGHTDSNPESNSGSSDSDSEPNGGLSSDSQGSDDSDGGDFGDMFSARKTHKPTTKKQESRAQSSSRSLSHETDSQKWAHTPSPENDPHPDKPEWKKKKPTSGKSGMPKGPSKATPKVIDKIAQEVGEDLIRKFQEEEDRQEHRSQSKKSKKDSDRKKEQEEEYRRQKKKKKKEKERKEREEREAKEAKRQAEQQQLEADKRTARAKLIHTVRLEKYSEELPELQAYRKKYMTSTQHATVNLDSHARYLELIRQDKSLYPNRNVILGTRLIEQLWKNGQNTEVDNVQAVIDKGMNCHTPGHFPDLDSLPIIHPLYFIRCLQRSNGAMLDSTDDNYGDDQNIGLHDLVSQPSMRCLCTSRKVTVNNRRLTTPIDARYCPFCEYHSGCHKTLNNHIWIHLGLSLFCGIGGCFFTTSCCKALIQHAVMKHPCYEKLKELNPKKGGSG